MITSDDLCHYSYSSSSSSSTFIKYIRGPFKVNLKLNFTDLIVLVFAVI